MCLTLTVAYLVPTLCGAGVDSRHRSVVGPGGRQTGERLDRPIDRGGGGGDDDDDDDAVVTRLSRARSAEEELPRELVSFLWRARDIQTNHANAKRYRWNVDVGETV